MKQLMFAVLLVVLAANVSAQRQSGRGRETQTQAPDPAAGQPLSGLTASQRADFADGLGDFTEVERVTDGLGPVFNERSCAACHSVPAIGGGSNRQVTRFATRTNGLFDALASLGGSLVQDHAIGLRDGVAHNFRPEVVPPAATIVVRRRTTPLFGLGLVDATPDSDFIAAAQQQAARGNGVAGRVNMVNNIRAGVKTVGKFGWKAQVPSLLQFSGDAYLNEMGITTADFPNESCPQGDCAELAFNPAPGINDDGSGVRALTNYMSMLAPPPRGTITGDVTAGEATFDRIGCTACHVATQRTGSNPVAALDRKTYHPYSDFLLHEMGALGDNLEMGNSTGTETRTAPLWGLRFLNNYLHDGRARTLDQAILAHDGQARSARDQYAGLAADARSKLIAFLNSL
jgi:CxxC motif-containing protein (DUF1111 family)